VSGDFLKIEIFERVFNTKQKATMETKRWI